MKGLTSKKKKYSRSSKKFSQKNFLWTFNQLKIRFFGSADVFKNGSFLISIIFFQRMALVLNFLKAKEFNVTEYAFFVVVAVVAVVVVVVVDVVIVVNIVVMAVSFFDWHRGKVQGLFSRLRCHLGLESSSSITKAKL